jgi:hypothetical protein
VAERATSSAKTVAVVVAAVLGFLALGSAGLLYVGTRVTAFVTEPRWSAEAVPRRDVYRVFGVRLPEKALEYRSRSAGFQDPLLEALVAIPPESLPEFLARNGLQVSAEAPEPNPDAEEELRALRPDAQHVSAVGLEGLKDLLANDEGAVALYRHAVLFTVDSERWLYLMAFGT